MDFRRIKETCLYVADLERSRVFYEGKLGLKCFSFVPGRHAFFRAGESVLLCFLPEVTRNEKRLPPHYGEGKLHLAFKCQREEYPSWKEKVVQAGISITHTEGCSDEQESFYFDDPDGNVLEVIMEGLWE